MIQSAQSTQPASPVDLLIIGHVTRDLIDPDSQTEYLLGGTVSFAAITALRLGRNPTVLTSAADDVDLSELPPEVKMYVLPSKQTTTFANVYTPQGRIQYCYAQASSIRAENVPAALRRPSVVLLGPLVGEVEEDVAAVFHAQTLVAAVPQGWMRRWDETGRVYSKPWENEASILPHLDVLVLSQEDIDYDLNRLQIAFEQVPLVVLTEYRDGSTIYRRQLEGTMEQIKIPPRPAKEVDPTGAGDVFATAFLLRLQETNDPVQAARFANVTASFGVEAEGISGIPTREHVLAYMDEFPFTP